MKKIILPLLFLFSQCNAREGMYMPQLLSAVEGDMKSLGMKISAEDIYSINKSSLKDAIVHFGGGCTGEIISPKGLLITNHHCGFSQIQAASTIEKNYLEKGFWAVSMADEIPCPGLTITLIKEITDVTEIVLAGIGPDLNEDDRNAQIKSRTDSLEKTIDGNLRGSVRHFYHGNKFYLFTTETYSDIRLAGAPPQSIGKFGGETDNWMWPRHTGDFALFRIYAGKDNKPAAYATDNVPYVPKQFLSINISGVKENDFVLVYGFPGRTNQYLLSPALETIAAQTNPNRIAIREARKEVWLEDMKANDTIRLQYSSKFSTLVNTYKKWKGEQMGFRKYDAIDKKKKKESEFFRRMAAHPQLIGSKDLRAEFAGLNSRSVPLNFANDFFAEAFPSMEIIGASMRMRPLVNLCEKDSTDATKISAEVEKLKKDFRGFYKNYSMRTDKKVSAKMLNHIYSNLDRKYIPQPILSAGDKSPDFRKFTKKLFSKSLVSDSTKMMKFLDNFTRKDASKIRKDRAYSLAIDISEKQKALQAELGKINKDMTVLQRKYMNNLLTLEGENKLYPDANSTLRISYGKAEGTIPADGISYNYFTTTDGIYEKSGMGIDDYKIPARLKELIEKKDFGRFAVNGSVPVAFIASAHTTGGNSGSPALNAKGELIGVNYDRIWEGVLSDYYYDEKFCRNICLDIRYALFIIDKFGSAGHLIEEMKLVE